MLTFPNNIKGHMNGVFLAQALGLMSCKSTQLINCGINKALLTIKHVQLVNSQELDLQSCYMCK